MREMGLFSKPLARSDVQFSGVEAYANSGDEDVAISAQVDLTQTEDTLGVADTAALMGALGAARLLSLLRREPQYVEDFMILIKALGMQLYVEDDPASFSVRHLPMLQGGLFAPLIERLDAPNMSYTEHSPNAAAIGGSLPETVSSLPDPAERSTSLLLMNSKHGPTVEFKFKMGSANALTTIGAWAATVDECVRSRPKERGAVPLAWGLRGLTAIWDDLGQPPGVPVKLSMQIDQGITQIVLQYSA
jgi:hypothetical protein